MIKIINKYWFYLLGLSLLISCDPSPTSGIQVEIPEVTWQISETKDVYKIGDTITLQLSFKSDFLKFNNYRLGMKVYYEDGSDLAYDSILLELNANNCTNREIIIDSSYDVGDSQIKLLFNSSILKSGRYYISTYLIGNQKKITNYRYITRQRIPIIIE